MQGRPRENAVNLKVVLPDPIWDWPPGSAIIK